MEELEYEAVWLTRASPKVVGHCDGCKADGDSLLLNVEVEGNYLSFCPACEQLLLQKLLANYLRRAKRGKAKFQLEKPSTDELDTPLPIETFPGLEEEADGA